MAINILAIESSCDETSAAIIADGKILSNIIATQQIHQSYGGVVPELASRAHEKILIPVIAEAFVKANITKNQLNAVAFTQGPGLLGSLLTGTCFAKSMALGLGIPLIGINHMEAHILAHFIDAPFPVFPFLCLTVSGGHTQIVLVSGFGQMEIIGETIDDAVGEAFDKTAKMLQIPYPGGPLVDKYAQLGNPSKYLFKIPEIAGLNFSFSGIKTAILYFLRDHLQSDPQFIEKNLADICASVQHTFVEILLRKLKKAAQIHHISHIAIAGGVAANSELRKRLGAERVSSGWEVYIPKFEYCTDNAAMIAIAAHYKYQKELFTDQSVVPNARMALSSW